MRAAMTLSSIATTVPIMILQMASRASHFTTRTFRGARRVGVLPLTPSSAQDV